MPNFTSTSPAIQHDVAAQEFRIPLDDGAVAYVRYALDQSANSVDIVSTFVPDSHRGQGLAEVLVDTAFSWAEESGLAISTSCWYARIKLEKRREAAGDTHHV